MAQEPNIELQMSSMPRPSAKTAPARSWKPGRPGDFDGPEDVPWGGAFGTTGPDTGYALKLIKQRTLALVPGEDHHNAEDAISALVAARASHTGRAPTGRDVDVAMLILGYAPEGIPSELIEAIAADRLHHTANLGHDVRRTRALVSAVMLEDLTAGLTAVKTKMEQGQRLVNW